ncbi:ATP-binding protein [Gemmatimonadota bacterium]
MAKRGRLVHSTPVVFNGARFASLQVELSLARLEADVARARSIVASASLIVFLLGILAALIIGAHVLAPLGEVVDTVERIASGDLGSRARVSTPDEVGQLAASFNRMVDRLQAAHQEAEVSRVQLEQVLDNIPADVAMFDPEGRYLYVNPAAIQDSEEREWVIGQTAVEYGQMIGSAEGVGRAAMEAIQRCVAERRLVRTEQTLSSWGGEEKHYIRLFSPILDGQRAVTRVIAYGLDITDLRDAEGELRETQEQLLQSQKMESMGRLAGGIAHDFNNLLTTITGNADLLLMDMDPDDPARDDVEEIHGATSRAAALTQQLLAFSRKQVTQPRVLNLNSTLSGIENMLQRLIGEDVRLSTELDEDLESVRADPGQIEQVIVNLAANSRDAMPRGGVLAIRTRNHLIEAHGGESGLEELPAGRYVMVSVSDTGDGMDEETRKRIFEPFFTRKGAGKGTGLGLATAYGIIRQASGLIRVYSEVGMGTTFKIFLPSVDEAPDPEGDERQDLAPARGKETVLVAEDQEGVRIMTQKVLERCGYRVLVAEGPEEALMLAGEFPEPIHLLLTDVVMPGMSGPELVKRMNPRRPETAVVYMSGYTDDQLQHHGVLDEDVILIEKPFSAQRLTVTVRSALDGLRTDPGERYH